MLRAAVVIPQWNRSDLLKGLLSQLGSQTHPVHEIVVVDNGSTDDSVTVAAAFGARVIRFETNKGFAPAVNRGIDAVDADVVAVINNDVELDAGWLEHLTRAIESDESAWFASGKIFDAADRNKLDGAFDLVCRGGTAWRAGSGRRDASDFSQRSPIDIAPWTAAVFRRKLFERAGRLDEAFGSYLEDVDFGLRCAALGLRGVYVPDAICWHHGSATLGRWSPAQVRLIARNQMLIVARHFPTGWLRRLGWKVVVAQCLWGVLAVRRGAGAAWLSGKWEGFKQYRSARRTVMPSRAIEDVLERGESKIRELQSRLGWDWYWRWYFRLT